MPDNTIINAGIGGDTIRDVDRSGVKTQVVAIDLNPAGAEVLMAGALPVAQRIDQLVYGAAFLVPAFAPISASGSGATSVVAGATGKRIVVVKWSLSASGDVNVKWQSRLPTSELTDITGLHYMTQYASAGGAYCPVGHFETYIGESLCINLSGAVAVGGELTYVVI